MGKSESHKLQIKDFITLGILNAVIIVIMSIFNIALFAIPLTFVLAPALAALPIGIVFMLMLVKVPKAGVFAISGLTQAAAQLLLGSPLWLAAGIFVFALAGEIVNLQNTRRNFGKLTIGYILLITGYSFGAFAPIAFFADAYRQRALKQGYDEAYIDHLVSFLNLPMLVLALTVAIAGALGGAFLGRKMLRKHFVKAGMV